MEMGAGRWNQAPRGKGGACGGALDILGPMHQPPAPTPLAATHPRGACPAPWRAPAPTPRPRRPPSPPEPRSSPWWRRSRGSTLGLARGRDRESADWGRAGGQRRGPAWALAGAVLPFPLAPLARTSRAARGPLPSAPRPLPCPRHCPPRTAGSRRRPLRPRSPPAACPCPGGTPAAPRPRGAPGSPGGRTFWAGAGWGGAGGVGWGSGGVGRRRRSAPRCVLAGPGLKRATPSIKAMAPACTTPPKPRPGLICRL
jgi:hypothetical protein